MRRVMVVVVKLVMLVVARMVVLVVVLLELREAKAEGNESAGCLTQVGLRVLTGTRAQDLHSFGAVPFVHGPELVAAAAHPIGAHRLQFHADVETFLETTIGTPFPLWFVYVTSAICDARVNLFVLHSPLEEALAALASQQSIMVAAVVQLTQLH